LSFSHRLARRDDMPALQSVMDLAMRVLLPDYLSQDQAEASFAIMGLDSQLIDDGTYFVVESDGRIAGCGGWSRRATLFGGDHSAGRDTAVLDPARDAARIRAMYTDPQYARRGVGRRILELCERAAALGGFRRVELAATLSGLPLYRACGYEEVEPFFADTPSGIRVPLVRMSKALGPAN
jgi:GNAT superfamily N-acetyltransferase